MLAARWTQGSDSVAGTFRSQTKMVALLLVLLGAFRFIASGSSSHSMDGMYSALWEPSQGLVQFSGVTYVDGQLATYYDSQTRRAQPRISWMKNVEKYYPQFWDINTWRFQSSEQRFRRDLVNLQKHYNQTRGFHTWQLACGCEIHEDGRREGYCQYGYDGKDFLSFDKETLTWTAADVPAQFTKRNWEVDVTWSRHLKFYLEEECPDWLPKLLECGKEELQRKDPPKVKVTRMAGQDELETLICQAYGFYPKEIDTTWRKDREVLEQQTIRRDVAPNSDGTYYAWLSIQIDPEDKDHYWCHVEHDGLLEPLDVAFREPGSSSHSMDGMYSALWEPSQGLVQFSGVMYVDGQLATYYDSQTRRAQPRISWMKNVEKYYPQFWDINTWRFQSSEQRFRRDLVNLQKHYNQTRGFHTWQLACGCEIHEDGRREGYCQYGYDGKDFLSFDKETLTRTAADVPAQFTKRKWEVDVGWSRHLKFYLEEECPDWLPKLLECEKEELQRKDPPTVKVTLMAGHDGLETLICQAYGFYPKEIDTTWRKDRKVLEQETFRRDVAPNSDGTYYAWLSIRIDPEDKDHYWCHIEHDGLLEPLDVAFREPALKRSHLRSILGVVPAVVILLVLSGIIVYITKYSVGAPED
ncbi:major histocompatibility complex class I-related gene protein-like isoform X2 [Rhineura floridana]|uniref:major histocompatibility complex class I-related gene protein-like isoform X2 n=1 Tax=Rhineura floridana TaxID=261503 RepID=UPI002AC83AA5|nr:major histocompatibility complex class I-related gene protein-like isoform X2 [Rhineura floridana]